MQIGLLKQSGTDSRAGSKLELWVGGFKILAEIINCLNNCFDWYTFMTPSYRRKFDLGINSKIRYQLITQKAHLIILMLIFRRWSISQTFGLAANSRRTVKEGNFVLEYNFVQKKVFLCKLLLTYLSSWRVKKIFLRSK